MRDPNNLIWLDLEMTGLDPEHDHILEIASVATDKDLNILEEGPNISIKQSDEILARGEENLMKDRAMREKFPNANTLIVSSRKSTITAEEAEKEVLQFVKKHIPYGESPLCGNTIWMDKRFLYKYMPMLADYFHYRVIDVSSIKELVKRWYPNVSPYIKKGAHRALQDTYESIEELKYYRSNTFHL